MARADSPSPEASSTRARLSRWWAWAASKPSAPADPAARVRWAFASAYRCSASASSPRSPSACPSAQSSPSGASRPSARSHAAAPAASSPVAISAQAASSQLVPTSQTSPNRSSSGRHASSRASASTGRPPWVCTNARCSRATAAACGSPSASGLLEVGDRPHQVAPGRLEPPAQGQRGRALRLADGGSGVEGGPHPVRALDTGAEHDPGPPEPEHDTHPQVGVVVGRPRQRGIQVRALGARQGEVLGLFRPAQPRPAPGRRPLRTTGRARRRRRRPARPRPAAPGPGRARCRAAGSAPARAGRCRPWPATGRPAATRRRAPSRRARPVPPAPTRRRRSGAPPAKAASAHKPTLVVGEEQVVAPRQGGAQRAPAPGGGWSGRAAGRTCPRAGGRSRAPGAPGCGPRRARWPAAARPAPGRPPPRCAASRRRRPRGGRWAAGPLARTAPPSPSSVRGCRSSTCSPPTRSGSWLVASTRTPGAAASRRPATSATASTTCSQLSSTSSSSSPRSRPVTPCPGSGRRGRAPHRCRATRRGVRGGLHPRQPGATAAPCGGPPPATAGSCRPRPDRSRVTRRLLGQQRPTRRSRCCIAADERARCRGQVAAHRLA